jgi:hypothetical protein
MNQDSLTLAQLKQQLETLTHRDRVLRLVDLGARAKTDDRVNQILARQTGIPTPYRNRLVLG